MAYEIVMAVGTSTLGWMLRLDRDLEFPMGWLPNAHDAPSAPPIEEWKVRLRHACSEEGRTSAELDSLRAWMSAKERKESLRPSDVARIHLIVSDTDAAVWVAKLLPDVFATAVGAGLTVPEPYVVEGLSTDDPRLASGVALKNFVKTVARVVSDVRGRGATPAINATAGFKPEAALLTLLGAFARVEVFYLHEQMRDVVIFPPLPIAWDPDVVDQHARELVAATVGAADRDDATLAEALWGDPQWQELWPFVDVIRLDDGQRQFGLTTFGELLMQSSSVLGAPPPPREEEYRWTLKSNEGGHRPRGTEALARRIGEELPFATLGSEDGRHGDRVRPHQEGLLRPRAGDAERGWVRLRLRSSDGYLVRFVVYTTAQNEHQWRAARLRAAEVFDRVPLREELEVEGEDDKGAGDEDERAAWVSRLMAAAREALERLPERDEPQEEQEFERLDNLQAALGLLVQSDQTVQQLREEVDSVTGEITDTKTSLRKTEGRLERSQEEGRLAQGKLEKAKRELREAQNELAASRPPYDLVQLDPRPGATNPPYDVAIEVTALPLPPGVLRLDHHDGAGEDTPSACEQALHLPKGELPLPSATLATVRPDADSIAAMAVLRARRLERHVNPSLVSAIGRLDREGPRAESELGKRRDAVIAIARVALDAGRTLEERVAFVQRVLESKGDERELRTLARERDRELDEARQQSRVRVVEPEVLVVVTSTHRHALQIGYEHATTVIACNPAMDVPAPEEEGGRRTVKKFTVSRWAAHVQADLMAAAGELNRLEAERRGLQPPDLENGWGGRDTIIGSPQNEDSALDVDEVVDVVRRHLGPAAPAG